MFERLIIAALFLIVASVAIAESLLEMRMTPAEIRASALDDNQVGSAGLTGIHTKVLFGDPTKAGFYTLLLFVPAHTTIQAHSHRDDRVATVVSGEWHFGYGDHFDTGALKTLPLGSVYSEPGGVNHNHFAQTAANPVIVQISGYGPTDTHYFDAANDPRSQERKQFRLDASDGSAFSTGKVIVFRNGAVRSNRMRYRIFGRRIGLRVSELALGTGNFGTGWGHGAERAEAKRIFDGYVEAGGNFLDTTDNSQFGQSEELAAALSTLKVAIHSPQDFDNPRKNKQDTLSASIIRDYGDMS